MLELGRTFLELLVSSLFPLHLPPPVSFRIVLSSAPILSLFMLSLQWALWHEYD